MTDQATLNITLTDDSIILAVAGHEHVMSHTAATTFANTLLRDIETAGADGRTDVGMNLNGRTIRTSIRNAIALAESILGWTETTP